MVGNAQQAPAATQQTQPPQQRKRRVIFSAAAAEHAGTQHVFELEPVAAAAAGESAASGLTALLGGESGRGAPGPTERDLKKVRVHIGCIRRKGMVELSVATHTTFMQAVAEVLSRDNGGGKEAPPATAYEMLMADDDGEPDDDVLPSQDKPLSTLGRTASAAVGEGGKVAAGGGGWRVAAAAAACPPAGRLQRYGAPAARGPWEKPGTGTHTAASRTCLSQSSCLRCAASGGAAAAGAACVHAAALRRPTARARARHERAPRVSHAAD